MMPEFNLDQIKAFDQKEFKSIAARMVKSALYYYNFELNESYELNQRLESIRSYLMSVEPDEINIGDALESAGFGQNGLRHND